VTPKFTATYKFDDQRLVYATVSKGFRPGGTNTIGSQYQSDTLQNYEVGWKTSWLGNTLRVNGAIFEEDWKDFQFSYQGPNGIIINKNAGGARIRGIETSIDWAATSALTFGGGFSLLNPILTVPYCKYPDQNGGIQTATCFDYSSGSPVAKPFGAPAGQQLPTTPKSKAISPPRYNLPGSANGSPCSRFVGVPVSGLVGCAHGGARDPRPAACLRAGRRQHRCGEGRARGRVVHQQCVRPVAENYRYAECNATVCGVQRFITTSTSRA